jgi:hypothetical protein
MTRFEELMSKRNDCIEASFSCRCPRMRIFWMENARALKEIAYSLTLAQAAQYVN